MARIKDIAEIAGVSSAAVSLYLKDRSTTRVGKDRKRKIDEAIATLDYRPNAFARALSRSKSYTIGVLIPYEGPMFRSSFLNEMLSGMQTEFFRNSYTLAFPPASGGRSPAVLRHQLEHATGFDGYVVFATRYCTLEDMEENARILKRVGIPFAMANSPELDDGVNQVILREGHNANAVRYLLEQGHREIAVMVGRHKSPDSEAGIELARATCKQFGVELPEENILFGDYEHSVARSSMLSCLSKGRTVTGIYCLSDTMAMGVYEAITEYGLRIPTDFSIIGRNDSYFARLLTPPLTTVYRSLYEAGTRTAEVLLRSMDTGQSGMKIYLDGSLIVRGSTGRPGTSIDESS